MLQIGSSSRRSLVQHAWNSALNKFKGRFFRPTMTMWDLLMVLVLRGSSSSLSWSPFPAGALPASIGRWGVTDYSLSWSPFPTGALPASIGRRGVTDYSLWKPGKESQTYCSHQVLG